MRVDLSALLALPGVITPDTGEERLERSKRVLFELLGEAVERLKGLKERATRAAAPGNREYNPGWHTALDLENLLTVSEAITRSALLRKESRGAHFREDYPEKNEAAAKVNTAARRGPDGEMLVEQMPLVSMSDELAKLVKEMQ